MPRPPSPSPSPAASIPAGEEQPWGTTVALGCSWLGVAASPWVSTSPSLPRGDLATLGPAEGAKVAFG